MSCLKLSFSNLCQGVCMWLRSLLSAFIWPSADTLVWGTSCLAVLSPAPLLLPWHTQVAFNFVPSREHFMEQVAGANDPDAVTAMQSFIDSFSPILTEVHKFLVSGRGSSSGSSDSSSSTAGKTAGAAVAAKAAAAASAVGCGLWLFNCSSCSECNLSGSSLAQENNMICRGASVTATAAAPAVLPP